MAKPYRIDKSRRIVTLEGGQPNIEEWRQLMLAVFADPDFETGFHFLSDRRASEQPRSTDFLRAALLFLNAHKEKLGRCRWATVVSTTAAYGMARMVQILSEDMTIELEVFTEIEKAREWLLEDASPAAAEETDS